MKINRRYFTKQIKNNYLKAGWNLGTGFTLFELLIVIAIVGLLAGLISSAAHIARGRSLRTQAESMIAAIETAISMYSVDVGTWPDDAPMLRPQIAPYIDIKAKDSSITGTGIRDPWGQDYNYDVQVGELLPWGNVNSYNLWSNGPDQVNGSPDDIFNW
ncbi:MAG: type II secretion system protein GspG [Candidatus Omnitrophota bacterium]